MMFAHFDSLLSYFNPKLKAISIKEASLGSFMMLLRDSYQHKVMLECVSSSDSCWLMVCIWGLLLGWGTWRFSSADGVEIWPYCTRVDPAFSTSMNVHWCLQSEARWSGQWSALLQTWETALAFLNVIMGCWQVSGMLNLVIWPNLTQLRTQSVQLPFSHDLNRQMLMRMRLSMFVLRECWSSAVVISTKFY